MRAYAITPGTNGNVTTYSSQEQNFTTEVQVVTTMDVIHIKTDYAVGVGKVVSGSYEGTVTERGVCYTSSSTNHTPHIDDVDVTKISSGSGVGNYSVEMTGLSANTTYYMRTYAIVTDDDDNTTVYYGEKRVFTTHVHMQNGTIEVNDAGFVFTDSDADPDGGWYNHFEDYTIVFIPENSSKGIQIVFDSLLINNDYLYFYDGDISPNNLIGVYTCNDYHAYSHGTNEQVSVFGLGGNLFTVTSHSYMTVRFSSDYHWRDYGWRARVSQVSYTPQPPTIAKLACSNEEFELLPTSKGQYSTTLKYSYATNGEEPGEPTFVYDTDSHTPININGNYTSVKFKVMTEIKESDTANAVISEMKVYTFGDESIVEPPYSPVITLIENTSTVSISVVRPGDLNDTWSIRYTLDGTDPITSSTAQVITHTDENPNTYEVTTSGTVALPDCVTVKAVVQGTTCPEYFSEIAEWQCDENLTIQLLPPTITFDGNGSTASTTITASATDCTIYYKVNGGAQQTYTGPFQVNANDRVEAWVEKAPATIYLPSTHAIATYLPGNDNPGSGTGVFGEVVYLDDREPHSWSYYSDKNQPVHSLNPKDVKITYFGFGDKTMTTTNTDNDPANSAFNGDVAPDAVAVGPGAPGNQFVYFETLEAGRYSIDNSGYINLEPDYDGANHDYPYTTIPNPFSVRPTYTTVTTTRNIYVRGTIQDNAFGYINVTYTDVNNTQQTWSGYINWSQQQGSIYPVANLQVLAGTQVSFSLYTAGWGQNGGSIGAEVRYDDANGAVIWNERAYYNTNNQNNPVTVSATVQEGGPGGGPIITNTDYRGFYAWRVKRLKGVTIKDAYGTTYDEEENPIIPAETRLLFHIENEYDNEVDFEALWAKAYVVESNTESGLNANVSYERNFVVGVTNIGTNSLTVPVTYSSYYPDGTQVYYGNVTLGNFTCRADTKFEYMNLRFGTNSNWGFNPSNDIALTADNHYFCLGRGLNIDEENTPNRVEGIPNANQNDLKYTLRVESGKYNRLSFVRDNDTRRIISGRYLVKGIMGCDYDRAQNVNDNLIFGNNPNFTPDNYDNDVNNRIFLSYGMSFTGTQNLDRQTFDLVVKSGQYQPQFWYNGGNGRHSRSF